MKTSVSHDTLVASTMQPSSQSPALGRHLTHGEL